MKAIKRRAAALVLALLMGIGMLPTASAAPSSFTDISDSKTAEHVEVLRMMGVIDGMTDTTFEPDGTLTRAQFCKMAISVLGKADRVGLYKNYTIFPDVKGNHWAAGYINMAVRGENKFISGFTNGTFGPNRTITYGQAITILMRLLGYTDADVGIVWPEGYINAALENGLSNGVTLSGNSALTRAQAARLFVNLLNADTKTGGKFLSSVGNAVSDVILLDANAKDENGAAAILTSSGTYPIAVNPGSGALTGRKGTVLLNDAGKVLTFVPTNVGESKDITIATAAADTLTDTAGVKYKVFSDTLTYCNGEKGIYGTQHVFFRAGTQATVYTGVTGKVEHVVVGAAASDEAVVVSADKSTAGFSLLTERTDYAIYKNGEKVTAAALRKYDVATYSSANNTVYVCDDRLAVYYKNAYPNTASPATITVTGISEPLPVLHCAMETISKYRIGQTMVLLLTQDGRVAGAVSGGVRSNSVGYVEADRVRLFNGLIIDTDLPANAKELTGFLVNVAAADKNKVTLTKIGSSGTSRDLDVAARKVGNIALAANVRVYEKVGSSALTEISLADIPVEKVPAAKITYLRKNYDGRIDLLVLNDVTGKQYTYGRITTEWVEGGFGDMTYRNQYVTVHRGGNVSVGPLMCAAFSEGEWGGIVAAGDGERVAGYAKLTAIKNVPLSAWRSPTLFYHDNTAYTVASDIACYNKLAGVWFNSLSEALAFGEKMTVYVDNNHIVRGLEVG